MNTGPPKFLLYVVFAAALCVLALPTPASGQASAQLMPPSSYKLISITASGSQRFTQQEIAAASGLQLGTTVSDNDFHRAARDIGESGAFTDISYTYSYSPEGTKLHFQVTDAAQFVPVHFVDFVWFSDDQLRQKVHERVPLFNGEVPVTGHLLDEVSDVLQALLVENAIPGHVDYLRSNDTNHRIESIYFSVSGVTILVHGVAFTGAGADELPLLQSAAQKLVDREYARGSLVVFIGRSLLPVYHDRGYLKAAITPEAPKVVKPSVSGTENNRNQTFVDVTLAVIPGLQYKLNRVDWSGNKEFPTDTLQQLLHFKFGQPANMGQLTDDLKEVQTLYGSRGYVTTAIKAGAEFDEAAGTVAYQLQVTEGPVFHMGDLEFRGLDNGLTARLRDAWKLRPGDVYDATYLDQYLPQALKLLPANFDWDVSHHVTANIRDKTVDVDLQYTAKAPL
ncbi:MAG: POTRA domain-containing protein [Candidatus Sulfotelmatobacter sp.]